MDHAPVSSRSQTRFLLLAKGLEFLFPCTAWMLGIHSYGVLLSYNWYTKWIFLGPYPCFGLAKMLSYSNPPSNPLWMDLSSDIGSLPVVGLPAEPLPEFETSAISKGISGVVSRNSQIDVYVAYLSWHTLSFPSIVWIYGQFSIQIILVSI